MGHVYKVNKLLEKLRSYLLGQDVRFETLLPVGMKAACDERKAEYLADRFLFEIARQQDYLQGEELKMMHLWLYEAVLYLLTKVAEEDHTIDGVVRLISKPLEIREIIFDVKGFEFPHLAQEWGPPVAIEEIEDAMVKLNSELKMQERYQKITTILKCVS